MAITSFLKRNTGWTGVQYIQSKVIPRLKMLHKVRSVSNQSTSLKHSWHILDYGDIIYDGITDKESSKLQKLQNGARRIILRRGYLESTDEMHNDLGIDKLQLRRQKHICNKMYQCINKMAPTNLCDKLRYIREEHNVRTRQTVNDWLLVPDVRTLQCRRNFFYTGPKYWNSLSQHLKDYVSYDSFRRQKNKLKAIFI